MYFNHIPSHSNFYHKSIDSIFGISANLLAFFGTLFLGALALFGDQIRSLIFKPNLYPVELKKTSQSDGSEDYIFHRLIIKNVGRFPVFKIQAKNVRALLTYRKVPKNFIPIPLRWTHLNEAVSRDIPPGEEVYLDIIHKKINDQKYKFCWSPGTGSNDPVLKYFEPSNGHLRIEFFERNQMIGDIYLKYLEDKDLLEVVNYK